MSFTLGQIVSGLPAKSAGRNNWGTVADGSLGMVAAQQVIDEITETAELEELKAVTVLPPGTTMQLTVGNPIVPISAIITSLQANGYFTGQNVVDITDIYTYLKSLPPPPPASSIPLLNQ